MLQSRAAIQAEIDKVLQRSTGLTEQAKTKAANNVKLALSGSGFGDAAKRQLSKSIAPANTGFRKGGIADTFGGTGHPSDSLFPQGTGEVHQFSTGELVDSGPKPDTVFYDRFQEAMASQYPTVEAMHSVAPPTPTSTIEERFRGSATPKYSPTSGGSTVNETLGFSSKVAKSVADARLAKLTRLEKLVRLLASYVAGDDVAGVKLGIR